MLKSKIGEDAGRVYRYLESNGKATIAKMKKDLALDADEIYCALGWLAREDKVSLQKQGNSLAVSLI